MKHSICSFTHLAFWLITKLKCAIIQWKNNDTKDYSEKWEFLNSQPYYASKKFNQSSDFPVRRTGSYRHKKALEITDWLMVYLFAKKNLPSYSEVSRYFLLVCRVHYYKDEADSVLRQSVITSQTLP